MATTSWRSSLANIESRLRRSLGLSGPVDLALERPLQLLPVVIVDDSTRPGTATQVRGRRFRATYNNSFAAGNRVSHWLFVSPPDSAAAARPDAFSGGVIIDRVTYSTVAAVNSNIVVMLGIFATSSVLGIGIPVAVANTDVYFVDPMRTDGEPAPLSASVITTQDPGIARRIWEHTHPSILGAGGVFTPPIVIPCGDIFLNWNSCLVFGISNLLTQATTVYVTYEGRVF